MPASKSEIRLLTYCKYPLKTSEIIASIQDAIESCICFDQKSYNDIWQVVKKLKKRS